MCIGTSSQLDFDCIVKKYKKKLNERFLIQ